MTGNKTKEEQEELAEIYNLTTEEYDNVVQSEALESAQTAFNDGDEKKADEILLGLYYQQELNDEYRNHPNGNPHNGIFNSNAEAEFSNVGVGLYSLAELEYLSGGGSFSNWLSSFATYGSIVIDGIQLYNEPSLPRLWDLTKTSCALIPHYGTPISIGLGVVEKDVTEMYTFGVNLANILNDLSGPLYTDGNPMHYPLEIILGSLINNGGR